jgi:hypothetical protein
MVVFSSELLAYYDLTFIILVSTAQGRGIQTIVLVVSNSIKREISTGQARGISHLLIYFGTGSTRITLLGNFTD